MIAQCVSYNIINIHFRISFCFACGQVLCQFIACLLNRGCAELGVEVWRDKELERVRERELECEDAWCLF